MGYCPSWYRTIKAAKYLGVPPWELSGKPVAWQAMAEAAMEAEAHADQQRNKRRKGG